MAPISMEIWISTHFAFAQSGLGAEDGYPDLIQISAFWDIGSPLCRKPI